MKERNPNDALFRLIKSMNQGEKRFFTLLCSRQGSSKGKDYASLFHSIEKQKKYDEPFLKKQLKSKGILFVATKRYLYELVLDSLVQYYRTSPDKSLYGKILEIEVLFEKGLYDLYEVLLHKLRKVAEERADFLIVLETLKGERRLHIMRYKFYETEKLIELRTKERLYISLQEEIDDYLDLTNELVGYKNEFKNTNTKEFIALAELPLFTDVDRPRTLMSRLLLHNLRAVYYSLTNKSKSTLEEYSQMLELIESNPNFPKSSPAFTSTSFTNYISSCISLQEYEKALSGVEKFKVFIVQHPELLKHKMIILYNNELDIYKFTRKKEEGLKLIKEAQRQMDGGEIVVEDMSRMYFALNVGYFFLDLEDYRTSQQWCSKILNFPSAEKINFVVYYNARLLQLINLFETKDFDLLSYRLKAFQRVLRKYGKVEAPEQLVIDLFNGILACKSSTDQRELSKLFTRFKTSIEIAIKNRQASKELLFYSDISNWLNAVIEKYKFTAFGKRTVKK